MTGGDAVDQRVDLDAVADHVRDQFAGKFGRHGIAFRVRQVPLEDRLGGALPEVGLEDRGERQSTSRPAPGAPASALAISLRRHRR